MKENDSAKHPVLPPLKRVNGHTEDRAEETHRFPWLKLTFLSVALLLYTASPLDLIPDFIPVLGQMDDFAIDTGLLVMILRTVYGYYSGTPRRGGMKNAFRGLLLQRALRWVFSK